MIHCLWHQEYDYAGVELIDGPDAVDWCALWKEFRSNWEAIFEKYIKPHSCAPHDQCSFREAKFLCPQMVEVVAKVFWACLGCKEEVVTDLKGNQTERTFRDE